MWILESAHNTTHAKNDWNRWDPSRPTNVHLSRSALSNLWVGWDAAFAALSSSDVFTKEVW